MSPKPLSEFALFQCTPSYGVIPHNRSSVNQKRREALVAHLLAQIPRVRELEPAACYAAVDHYFTTAWKDTLEAHVSIRVMSSLYVAGILYGKNLQIHHDPQHKRLPGRGCLLARRDEAGLPHWVRGIDSSHCALTPGLLLGPNRSPPPTPLVNLLNTAIGLPQVFNRSLDKAFEEGGGRACLLQGLRQCSQGLRSPFQVVHRLCQVWRVVLRKEALSLVAQQTHGPKDPKSRLCLCAAQHTLATLKQILHPPKTEGTPFWAQHLGIELGAAPEDPRQVALRSQTGGFNTQTLIPEQWKSIFASIAQRLLPAAPENHAIEGEAAAHQEGEH